MIKAVVFDSTGVINLEPSRQPFNHPVADLVRRLRPRYRTAILSNGTIGFLERFLAEYKVRDRFDVVYTSSQSHYMKPEREIFAETAALLDVSLDEMVFIDDWVGNVSAATSYGIRSIVYENPRQLEQALTALEIL